MSPGRLVAALVAAGSLAGSPAARAQDGRHQATLALAASRYGEFADTDLALIATVSRAVGSSLALEAALGYAPAGLGGPLPFSGSRALLLLGARAGPRLGPARPFAAARAGLLRLAPAPEPFPCILIFPPPLACALAGGRTLPAVQLGAGVEAFPGRRGVARLEAGALLLRYPGPALGRDRRPFLDARWSPNFHVQLSLGLRF